MITTASFHQNPKTFTKANKQIKRRGLIPAFLILSMFFNIFDNRWIWVFNIINSKSVLFHKSKLYLFRWVINILNHTTILFYRSNLYFLAWVLDKSNCIPILFYRSKLYLLTWVFYILNVWPIFFY